MLGQAKIAMGVLATLLLSAAPVFAQHAVGRQIRPPKLPQKQAQQEQKQSARESERAVKNHAGDWLRRYKDLPPDQQRQALENDADFQKLPPHRQAQLLQRLQHFSSLPAKQQERILDRMETWEHLTRDQKRQAKDLFQQGMQEEGYSDASSRRAISNCRPTAAICSLQQCEACAT